VVFREPRPWHLEANWFNCAMKVEPVGEFVLKGIRRPWAAHNVLAAAS
jgi:hypothetical protein